MTWNTQDTNLSWYVPKANIDHTIRGQGTAVSTSDHSATTPSLNFVMAIDADSKIYWDCYCFLFDDIPCIIWDAVSLFLQQGYVI